MAIWDGVRMTPIGGYPVRIGVPTVEPPDIVVGYREVFQGLSVAVDGRNIEYGVVVTLGGDGQVQHVHAAQVGDDPPIRLQYRDHQTGTWVPVDQG